MRLFILSLVFLCLGITTPAMAEGDKKPLKIVTTFTIIADMAQEVAGDAAIVESITKPGAEIHDYQPTPQDIVRAQGADIILWNGLNLERWFERFLQDVKDVPSIVVTDGITPMSIYEGPYSGKPNPHAWMSIDNALVYVNNIQRILVRHDPKNADIYINNAAAYSEKLKAMKANLLAELSAIPPEQRYLVTSEGAFSYLAKDLQFKEIYLWPINAEQQGTPQQVRKVIDLVRERHIPVIFSESTVSDRPAKQIAAETGAHYGGILYVDSLSDAGGPVPTYLDLLLVTTHQIAQGFKESSNGQ